MNMDTIYGKSSHMLGRSFHMVHLQSFPRKGQGPSGDFLMNTFPSLWTVLAVRNVYRSIPEAAATRSTSSGRIMMFGWWQHFPHISQGKASLYDMHMSYARSRSFSISGGMESSPLRSYLPRYRAIGCLQRIPLKPSMNPSTERMRATATTAVRTVLILPSAVNALANENPPMRRPQAPKTSPPQYILKNHREIARMPNMAAIATIVVADTGFFVLSPPVPGSKYMLSFSHISRVFNPEFCKTLVGGGPRI